MAAAVEAAHQAGPDLPALLERAHAHFHRRLPELRDQVRSQALRRHPHGLIQAPREWEEYAAVSFLH